MRCLILLSLLLLQSECEPPASQVQERGHIIRVCSPDDMSDILAFENQWLAGSDVRFVQANSDCDVWVSFGKMPVHNANGVAYAISGKIILARNSPTINTDFMHEALHLAGVPHENDRTSVMWLYSGGPSLLHQHHVEALKGLAGISVAGRVGAQIGVMR